MKMIKAIMAAGLVCLAVNAAHGDTINIVNGDFENPTVNTSFNTYNGPNNSSSLPGWTINGSIDQIGTYWQAASGGQSLDMAGNSAGSIQQTVFVPFAGSATVSFWMAGNPDEQSLKTLAVSLIGNGSQTFTFNSMGHSRTSMGWVNYTATFVIPSAGNYILEFSDAGAQNDPYGPALDNVSMTAPDGGTTALLLGLGLLGIGCVRRFVRPLAA